MMKSVLNLLRFFFRVLCDLVGSKLQLCRNFLIVRKSRLFDKSYYALQFPSHERWWIRPLGILHYLVIGEGLIKNPNPLFQVAFYKTQIHESLSEGSFLVHYIVRASYGALRPNPFFISLYYIGKYHDVTSMGHQPLAHYYWHGWKENRDPSPVFNTKSYLEKNPHCLSLNKNPLADFLESEMAVPSEMNGLAHGMPLQILNSSPQISGDVAPGVNKTIDLIIPVYRRPDLVENLFDSLLASPDWSRVQKCIVVDDRGDSFTSKYLQELKTKSNKIEVVVNESNLGFLRGVNRAYSKVHSEIVILVNSDVQVPKNWLNRLVAPIEKFENVALVTPLATSGANLSVTLRPGQSWNDLDQIVSLNDPQYPEACTAIGYLMAVRRSAIDTGLLFDDVFQHGYGEDTDLHYKLVSKGWRSVVCDNLAILHKGSASYLLDDQKSKIYDSNRKIFFERWGDLHKQKHEQFVKENALSRILTPAGHTQKELVSEEIDVLFISPTNNRGIGGVKIIFELASYLCDRGVKAKVFCTEQSTSISDHAHDALMPIFRETTLHKLVKSSKYVVGTGIGVFDTTKKFCSFYNAKCWWLVQGPECFFGSGEHYELFKEAIKVADHVFTVSEYLSNLVRSFGVSKITTLPLGPDPMVFYPRDLTRKSKSLAVHLIDTPDKGARFAIKFAEEAKRIGYSIHFFGQSRLENILPKDLGHFHGKLDSDGLAKLFSSCEYYLDLSFMEGLGLLPLEAAMCGCIPVMTRKGAPELIFGDSAIWLNSHLDYKEFGLKVNDANKLMHPIEESSRNAYREFANALK